MGNLRTIDAVIIIVYFAVMAILGVVGYKKNKTSEDYFLAGKRLGTFSLAAMWMSSWIGGSSIVGTSTNAYELGITGGWYVLILSVGCLIFGLTFSKLANRLGNKLKDMTYPALITSRYDSRATTSARTTRGYDDYRAGERRTESRFDDSGYSGARTQRSSSRYSQPDSRYASGGNVPARATSQRVRVSPRSRTVMYSLHTLEDCCEVIDQLIANNTVVLTMDELDGRLLQRAVDTLSGAVFALHASIRKASDKTYLVAPMSVEINEAYDMDRRF